MNIFIEEIFTVGELVRVYDPNIGEEVNIRITKSGWCEEVKGCSSYPQWHEMFEGETINGFRPGRTVRGYTETRVRYDEYHHVLHDMCAFIVVEKGLDRVARDLRLARKYRRNSLFAVLTRIMELREQLRSRWGSEYLQEMLRPPEESLPFFLKSCGDKDHPMTRWLSSPKVVHDGHLIKTRDSDEIWRVIKVPKNCGCATYKMAEYTIYYRLGYPQVYVTADAKIGVVEEFLRMAMEGASKNFQERYRSSTPSA